MAVTTKKKQDDRTRAIYAALKGAFPNLSDDPKDVVYLYNPVAIRVRVIDDVFENKNITQRGRIIDKALKKLDKAITEDITMELTLTPEEATDASILMNLEFDDPNGSRL